MATRLCVVTNDGRLFEVVADLDEFEQKKGFTSPSEQAQLAKGIAAALTKARRPS
jgi:hypothetical protein